MANLVLDYYGGKDLYSDGDVEKHILEAVQNKWDILDLDKHVKAGEYYPFIYHLSVIRENILNWYPFKEKCRVLEIGSGCGAITRMLCERAGHVTSVELSKRRAEINYERNKDVENLDIIVGNLNDLTPDASYHYVVLNGVLEYACSFTEGNKPFHIFLKNIRRYLKPNGKILIAIENRLGAKYFAGALEDHTDKSFWGIKKYPGDKSARTFSKAEIVKLLREAGYMYQRFYYPFPDYKFPTEIFTDANINNGLYGRKNASLGKLENRLFDERILEDSLSEEKIMDKFANSFLVEASPAILEQEYILYAKLNSSRRREFSIGTVIKRKKWGRRSVFKYALTGEAAEHVRNIYQNTNIIKYSLKGEYQNGMIEYPFINGQTLNERIIRLTKENHIDHIIKMVKGAMDQILEKGFLKRNFYTEQFVKMFGPCRIDEEMECVNHVNIDLILDNIFATSKGYQIIDCEWFVEADVPKKFIVWRTLNELFHQNVDFREKITYQELLKNFDIDQNEEYCFREWANYFAENYVSDRRLNQYLKLYPEIDITQQISGKATVYTNIYVDSGNGFSENEKVCREMITDRLGDFHISFDLSPWNEITAIRWDPLEGEAVKCEDIVITIDGEEIEYYGCNDESSVKGLFMTTDPQYICMGIKPGCREMRVRGKMVCLKEADKLIEVWQRDIGDRIG